MSDLKKFPRPSVAVDVAVLTVIDGQLAVVLWRRSGLTETGRWALPGSFVHDRERLSAAVERTLESKCGIKGLAPTQLAVMDDPARDDRGWVLSVAHLDVVDEAMIGSRDTQGDVCLAAVRNNSNNSNYSDSRSVLDLPDGQEALPFDHERIAELAITELRDRYAIQPDPNGLLGPRFTIYQLRRLHEAIAGVEFQKDTFRRTMLPWLVQLDEFDQGVVGRPARLFSRRVEP